MNTRAKACRLICSDKTRGERIECRAKGPCEPWRRTFAYIENRRRNRIEELDAKGGAKG